MASHHESQQDYEDQLDPEFYDEDGNLLPECGMGLDDQCSMAGSEECDECPAMEALAQHNARNRPKDLL